MKRTLLLAIAAATLSPAHAQNTTPDYDSAVADVLALPYNPAAVPVGMDAAFAADDYPAAFPLTDTTGGTCCTGPVPDQPPLADLAPPFADFPDAFDLIELEAYDGTPLHAFAALRPGAPGIVVMHGFNTNGKYSVVRYAAFLYANGYSVIAPDHRDMGREWARGGSWHPEGTRRGQTLGWKEARDLLVAAEWLDAKGTTEIGVLGFSEGAQNTILALGIDHNRIIDTALTFSPPADQATLAQRSPATTSALLTTVVNNPDLCAYLTTVGAQPEFSATANYMLANASAVDTLDGLLGAGVTTPGLHFHANDDTLVPPWNATMLASRTNSMANQHTVLLPSGNHAYFTDRYWTQLAALTWFGTWLDPDASHTGRLPTVTQTPGGIPAGEQQIDMSNVTRAQGDAERFMGDLCPPADGPVGPSAIFEVSGSGPARTLDGRRSYSGWEGHRLASWSIDPGDGSPVVTGTDISAALVEHVYKPGTYTATLTVSDDTAREDSASESVHIDGSEFGVPRKGKVLGAGKWHQRQDDHDDSLYFAFIAFVHDGELKGGLVARDHELDLSIHARDITSLSSGAGLNCDGEVLDGERSFAFTAQGTLKVAGSEEGAAFFACGIDNGKHGRGKGSQPPDYFYAEVTNGNWSSGSRTGDNGIDGGNVYLRHPVEAGAETAAPSAASAQTASGPDEAEQQVLTLEPELISEAIAGAPVVLAATLDGDNTAGTPITLRWIGAGGAEGSAVAVSDAAGVSLFAIQMPAGEVEFTAWADELDSNPVRVTGR